MKKTIFTIKKIISPQSSLYLLLLLLPFLFQSCDEEKELKVSTDGNQQSYSGPSYPGASLNRLGPGENIGMLISFSFLAGLGKHHDRSSGIFNDASFGNPWNLYAGKTHGPSIVDNNSEANVEKIAKASKSKTASAFTSYLKGQAGIEFVQKRSKDGNTNITLNYLQVPLYVLYQTQSTSSGNFFGGLGPYFAYGIGGKMKTSSSETKSFNNTTGYKPFDAGLSLTAGYKITNSFSFSLAYDIGAVNIDRNTHGDKAKNRGISLNLMYPLNKLMKK